MKCPVLLSLFLCTVVLGQPSISDEAIWKDVTTWLQKQAPNSKPGELIRGYRENLIRQGLAADEAGSRTGLEPGHKDSRSAADRTKERKLTSPSCTIRRTVTP
ncbi:MAG TPA: hypothetical protein VGZ73_08280 [Bryobacteraceae bacterium]|nr:hypothetical protein [Bryobacteraceae bacterium]